MQATEAKYRTAKAELDELVSQMEGFLHIHFVSIHACALEPWSVGLPIPPERPFASLQPTTPPQLEWTAHDYKWCRTLCVRSLSYFLIIITWIVAAHRAACIVDIVAPLLHGQRLMRARFVRGRTIVILNLDPEPMNIVTLDLPSEPPLIGLTPLTPLTNAMGVMFV
ncbi:hypothetical protein B0H13DRAFT_2368351 [Mycena leptocephala]|nr:hypothetical protein B0H13DRAFT_2368351 [Mycena leptocephala]